MLDTKICLEIGTDGARMPLAEAEKTKAVVKTEV